MEYYSYIKALHIIFVVNWFAGLFYMPRLFIYSREASEKDDPEKSILIRQLLLMQRRLWYIITWPAAIITLCLALLLLTLQPGFLSQGWMQIKLVFVLGLYAYHFSLHFIFRLQQHEIFNYTSKQLRIWNEVATVFLFAVVFLVVVRTNMSWVTGIIGLILLVVVLMLGIKLYNTIRKKNEGNT
ncbi:MAG: CopD family protein [Chitinophagales bacterium]